MDRHDEAKDLRPMPADDTTPESDTPKREGDILGLGGSVVPKSSVDPTTEYDDESVARRRARSTEDQLDRESDMPREKGATGIDMGSGGSGTDIE
jgi:hypothetical protein